MRGSKVNNSRRCYFYLLFTVVAVVLLFVVSVVLVETTETTTAKTKNNNDPWTGLASIFLSPKLFLSISKEIQKFWLLSSSSSSSSLMSQSFPSLSLSWPQMNTIEKNDRYRIQSQHMRFDDEKRRSRRLLDFSEEEKEGVMENEERDKNKKKVLYIMTTMDEYNSGTRSTTRGSDRLQETIIPILSEGVHSLVNSNQYDVDLFLICHFTLSPERLQLVRNSLPKSVGLQVWNDATPLGYNTGNYNNKTSRMSNRMLALARQHRFVLKDKFPYYDFFICFEDDILIKADHVQNFIQMTNQLYKLREMAPKELPNLSRRDKEKSYYGPMTKDQLTRTIPGFIRLEVLLDEQRYGAQRKLAPVPVDNNFADGSTTLNTTTMRYVDPKICCHMSERRVMDNAKLPSSPTHDKLMIWEVDVFPLGVRKMPPLTPTDDSSNNDIVDNNDYTLDWVALQRGPKYNKIPSNAIYGDYWSGTKGYFGDKKRPPTDQRGYINNQAGWMATKRQIYEWHTTSYEEINDYNEGENQLLCPGGFLPPFNDPHFRFNGLDLRDVEWWSGGLHLVTARHACNMQRIINLHPDHFSKHMLYHGSNNKQTQLSGKREKFTKASNLFGQLNTVRKEAQYTMEKEASN